MGPVTLSSKTLVIRADVSSRIGAGHIMRCFALAQAWQLAGGQVVFLSHCESDTLRQRITDAGMEFISVAQLHPDSQDRETTLEVLRTRSAGTIENPTWLVLDGYHFDPVYQQAVRTAGCRLLVIDDMAHLPAYHADILLNQNLDTEKLKYNCDSDTALLLGPRYALLRQEFLAWRGWQREIPKAAHKVLVTMGGGDPDNVTGAVIRALSDLPGVEAVVVVGGSNPNLAALNAAIGDRPSTVRLVANATNMPELMAWADVAVAGAGTTSWELAFMGLPCLLMVLADNQRSVAQVLDRQGVSKSLGGGRQIDPAHLARALGALLLDAGQRGQMSRAGRTLVDGRGAGRVVTRLVARGLGLRRAKETDCRMIWTWANEPSVRQASFVSDPIPWDQHVRWFSAKMADGKCFYYVGSDDRDNPIGQIRFDLDGREGAVSLSLAPAMRGRGYGSALIVRGVEQFFADSQAEVVHAYIKPENQISLRAFERADFGFAAGTRIHGLEARHLILTRKPYGN